MLETLLQVGDTKERCGLILKDGTAVELTNIAENPETSFEINSEEMLPLLDSAVATWHTHPNSDPNLSGEDYRGFLSWPDLEHVIVGKRGGETVVCRFRVENGVVMICG